MEIEFGKRLPQDLDHAVSVSMPKWDEVVAFGEKHPCYLGKMMTGYPRYFLQPSTRALSDFFSRYGKGEYELFRPFASPRSAEKCVDYVKQRLGPNLQLHREELAIGNNGASQKENSCLRVAVIMASGEEAGLVQEYWKLSGEVMSSRLATFALSGLNGQLLEDSFTSKWELEREKGAQAKLIIRERISKIYSKGLTSKQTGTGPNDVLLFPSGITSIFTARQVVLAWSSLQGRASSDTTVVLGFPFKDTPMIMKATGPHQSFSVGDSRDLDNLETLLKAEGTRVSAVFTETPSNPLLRMTDLGRLRKLADRHEFFVVIDDTIGGLNIEVLKYADMVCTSLTKLFNGSSDVLAGSLALNPNSRFYEFALEYLSSTEVEDLLWCQDACKLEENSRNFEDRTLRTNQNTTTLLELVLKPALGDIFKAIHYPSLHSETKKNYDLVKSRVGGYGSLLSLTFFDEDTARRFYDSLKVYKGPSLGTNFTLAVPFTLLAHYDELEHVDLAYGVNPYLVRVSIGLEDTASLLSIFRKAIESARNKP
ncbi:LADA_0G09362g1_1 [Lachancea dasiensis]|uniref:LADA_0G09362g1_1 n=1 Tax=Lachancea dasiensis TaxID=1072105 RepID=A0A1G4JUL1_9SACH|nr:LADA_0G09362g1_1 [Lachancea dasiensis]